MVELMFKPVYRYSFRAEPCALLHKKWETLSRSLLDLNYKIPNKQTICLKDNLASGSINISSLVGEHDHNMLIEYTNIIETLVMSMLRHNGWEAIQIMPHKPTHYKMNKYHAALEIPAVTRQARDIHPMSCECWHNVCNDLPTLIQQWVNVWCFLNFG